MRNTKSAKGAARVPGRSGVAGLAKVPRLEELATDPGIAGVLDARTTDALTAKALMALNGLVSRKLTLSAANESSKPKPEGDRLITARAVAQRLGVSLVWVYHQKDLPFEVRLGTARRFSEDGLADFIRKRRGS